MGVFCHNDLLVGNILWDSKRGEVNFIDYEYAGWNYAAFEIGNHFNEYTGLDVLDYRKYYPSREKRSKWCRTYIESVKLSTSGDYEVTDALVSDFVDDVTLMGLASHFFWAILALVQAGVSDIEFDYVTYAKERFAEMDKVAAELGVDLHA